jgi:hypothetical protein
MNWRAAKCSVMYNTCTNWYTAPFVLPRRPHSKRALVLLALSATHFYHYTDRSVRRGACHPRLRDVLACFHAFVKLAQHGAAAGIAGP